MAYKGGIPSVVVVFLSAYVQAETFWNLTTTNVRAQLEAQQFLHSLAVKYALPKEAVFQFSNSGTVNGHYCTTYAQFLRSERIQGASAWICFSPSATPLEKGESVCDASCIAKQSKIRRPPQEVEGGAKLKMQFVLEKKAVDFGNVRNPFGQIRERSVEPILLKDDQGLKEAYIFKYKTQDPEGSYVTYVDAATGELLAYENRRLDFLGKGTAFQKNWQKGSPVQIDLEDLVEENRLHHSNFQILNADFKAALGIQGAFHYSVRNTHFDEVQVFVGMQNFLKGMRKLGYSPLWFFPVYVHYGDRFGNAFYDGEKFAFGDGDNDLFDLALDNSIPGHESGHALVDDLAKVLMIEGKGNGLAFHEGHADYIACALYNDPVIGEAVMRRGSYLRRCDTRLPYSALNDPDPHYGGQVWSGALWEARTEISKLTQDPVVDSLAVDMLMRLHPTGPLGTTTMSDAYLALLKSDKAKYKGAHIPLLRRIFEARDFVLQQNL